MSCRLTRDDLCRYVFGLLEEDEREKAEQHLKACAECRRTLASVQRSRDLLDLWTIEPPPAGLLDATRAAARKAIPPPKRPAVRVSPQSRESAWKWLRPRPLWGAAAALAAGVALVFAIPVVRAHARKATPQEVLLFGGSRLEPGVPAAYRLLVHDAKTKKPVQAARVQIALASSSGARIWGADGVTDRSGVSSFQAQLPNGLPEGRYQLELTAKSRAGRNRIERCVELCRPVRALVTTDRALYRPGQPIRLRVLALETAALRPMVARDVAVEILNHRREAVVKGIARTSDHGIAVADLELPDNLQPGDYMATARIGRQASRRPIRVGSYEPPRFRVRLTTDRSYCGPGGIVSGNLTAVYPSGKPVAGANVRLTVKRTARGGTTKETAVARTDASGQFPFTISFDQLLGGRKRGLADVEALLEAAVTDVLGHTQERTLGLVATKCPLRIDALPESGELAPGVENIVYVAAAYPDGRPARVRFTVRTTGATGRTSDAGIARVRVIPRGPMFRFTLVAQDPSGTKGWADKMFPVVREDEALLLRPDRAVYTSGDTVHLAVRSLSDGPVFLDVVRGRRTVLQREGAVKDGRGQVALGLPVGLFGTLRLHAYRITSGGEIVGDSRVIQVNREEGLSVAARLDKETYHPGDKAVLRVSVTKRNGSPVPVTLSLVGADKEVYALKEVRPPIESAHFASDGALLQPREEPCAGLAVGPGDVTAAEPKDDDGFAALLSLARGASPPRPIAGESLTQKEAHLRRARWTHTRRLAAAGTLLPFALLALFALPFLIYAASTLVRAHAQPAQEGTDSKALERTLRRLVLWWSLAVYVPALVAFLGLAFAARADLSNAWQPSATLAGLAALGMLAALFAATGRLQSTAQLNASPRLRQLVWLLPRTYLLGLIAAGGLALSVVAGVLGSDTVLGLFFALVALMLIVLGALAVIRHSMLRRVTAGRSLWLGLAHPATVALSLLVLGWLLSVVVGPPGDFPRSAFRLAEARKVLRDLAPPSLPPPKPDVRPLEKQLDEEPEKLPADLKEYALEPLIWEPELRTDASGEATVEIPLPDSVTTWQIVINAVSKHGELGSTVMPLRVAPKAGSSTRPTPR